MGVYELSTFREKQIMIVSSDGRKVIHSAIAETFRLQSSDPGKHHGRGKMSKVMSEVLSAILSGDFFLEGAGLQLASAFDRLWLQTMFHMFAYIQ